MATAELDPRSDIHGEWLPEQVWATVADSLFSVSFGEQRYTLVTSKGVAICRFARPRRERLYAIAWRSASP